METYTYSIQINIIEAPLAYRKDLYRLLNNLYLEDPDVFSYETLEGEENVVKSKENYLTYSIKVNITNATLEYRSGLYRLFNDLYFSEPEIFSYETLGIE